MKKLSDNNTLLADLERAGLTVITDPEELRKYRAVAPEYADDDECDND